MCATVKKVLADTAQRNVDLRKQSDMLLQTINELQETIFYLRCELENVRKAEIANTDIYFADLWS